MVKSKAAPATPHKRSRVVGAGPLRLEYLDPAQLADNPSNWRFHSKKQLAAIDGVIAGVGWAGALL